LTAVQIAPKAGSRSSFGGQDGAMVRGRRRTHLAGMHINGCGKTALADHCLDTDPLTDAARLDPRRVLRHLQPVASAGVRAGVVRVLWV
jgi:hypothetical protein